MVNIDDFVKRLEIILDYYGLNASSFADKIGVQRSSMSHLLSGRNKPSLDFVMKILDVFPEVDLYWILIGKGNFPKSENKTISNFQNTDSDFPSSSSKNYSGEDLFIPINNDENKSVIKSSIEIKKPNLSFEEDEIEKIVIFYKNGIFKAYVP
ncbi:helix-turn-helix domain-containing protein [Flavobacterium soyae]|uniref:helix-turn-helix domain-containing protein n=1 Tax=Flavobacterium soyae TaxID=2903098 RepID=UPI001E52342E|nr:helix-turn-helix transcriptional regulator [Flavobacterium soyae]MCD9573886.1 helix-turn-helix domain-containing protein [Flavobacterium soyae]